MKALSIAKSGTEIVAVGAGLAGSIYSSSIGSSSEDKSILLTENSRSSDWEKSATRYFIDLIKNPNNPNKLIDLPSLDPTKASSPHVETFKGACLSLMKKTDLSGSERLKRDTWCTKFESIRDRWEKYNEGEILTFSPNDPWEKKYDVFVAEDENLKVFLESLKQSSSSSSSEIYSKSSAANIWCLLLSDGKYEEEAYRSFESNCIFNGRSRLSFEDFSLLISG